MASNLGEKIYIKIYYFPPNNCTPITCMSPLSGFDSWVNPRVSTSPCENNQLHISLNKICLVIFRGCRIHRLLLCRGIRSPYNECPDIKHFDGEVPVILELWGVQSTSSLPSLPDPLWPGMVAPDSFLSMG